MWLPVVGFEDTYQVSDDGRVRSIDRVITRVRLGCPQRVPVQGRELRQQVDKAGYRYVQLNRQGVYKFSFVHCLVAEAFIGPRPLGMEVNHKNGDKSRNGVADIEYMTPGENLHHSRRVLGNQHGFYGANRKLTAADIPEIRRLYRAGMPPATIGDRFGVSDQAVHGIMVGRTWKHVPDPESHVSRVPCPQGGAAAKQRAKR